MRCVLKPSLRDASCCSVEVVNGAAGLRRRCFLDLARSCLVFEAELFDLVAFVRNEPGRKRLLFLAQVGFDGPVLARLERLDLEFPLDDHPQGRALYATGRELRSHLSPQERRQVEAEKIVKRAPRLLRADQVAGNIPRVFDRFLDGVLRYFVKDDAMHRLAVQRAFFFK